MTKIIAPNEKTIQEAAALLRAGGLVGMPTETVYGLAANACDGGAVAKIFAAKGRPSFNPLISHFYRAEDVARYAVMGDDAMALAAAFWPGPLTMILPRKGQTELSDLVTAGLDTVAVRVPGHLTARQLIKAAGVPLAAPSANKSGALSPTTPRHVAESLGDAVDLILADGACQVGLESTVVDLSTDEVSVLRAGAISAEDISHVLQRDVAYVHETGEVKSPGQLLKHYAPDTPVRLGAVDLRAGEALLAFGSTKFMGVEGGGYAHDLPAEKFLNLSADGDLYEAAANLFAMLKQLDLPENTAIAVMNIPNENIGIAINDRLKRAAAGSAR